TPSRIMRGLFLAVVMGGSLVGCCGVPSSNCAPATIPTGEWLQDPAAFWCDADLRLETDPHTGAKFCIDRDGLRQGASVMLSSGEPVVLQHYKDDRLHGLYREYYVDGTTAVEGYFVAGQKVGDWQWFHQDGPVALRGSYDENGRMTGTWT